MNYCLGTVQFGTDYGVQGAKQPEYDSVCEMLKFAISNGVENFDTASAYGNAEEVLGHFVKDYPKEAEKMRFISKLKPDAFSEKPKEDWGKTAVRNARSSLLKIGIDRFSAYLFHNAKYIYDNNAVRALSSVKNEGLSDAVGVSVYSPDEAMKALEYDEITVVQIPYNVFDRRLDKCVFFEKAIEKGVKVYARSSLLQGLAVMDPGQLPPRMSFARDYIVKYHRICNDFGIPVLNATIGYVAQKKGIDYVVFGVDSIKQLEEYISLEGTVLPGEMVEQIDTVFSDVEERLLNPSMWK